jgi:uncharacterized protein YycO
MKFKKLASSGLVIGLVLVCLCQNSFANNEYDSNNEDEIERIRAYRANNDPTMSTEEIIQYQLDEFDKVDEEIRKHGVESTEKDPNITRKITGTYPTRKGAILVTKNGILGALSGHAGIVYDKERTIESYSKPKKPSEPKEGVQIHKNDWASRYSTVYGLGVIPTTKAIDEKAAEWCYNKRGLPYNYNFANINRVDKFYCSQLVYRAYKAEANIDLNYLGGIVLPIDLVNSDLTQIIYTKGIY